MTIKTGAIVRHEKTGAAGRVVRTVARLNIYDWDGPWCYVSFDDGLTCWVPEKALRHQHRLRVRADENPWHPLRSDGNIVIQCDGVDRIGLHFDQKGVVVGHWPDGCAGEWEQLASVKWDEGVVGMPDGVVLDRMAALFATGDPEHESRWPGASGLEDLCELVEATGRDVTTPRPDIVWEAH